MRSVSFGIALASLLVLSACSGPHHRTLFGRGPAIVLKRETRPDGSELTWRLPSRGTEIHRATTTVVVKPRVGLVVSTIDGPTGATRAIKAWEGVLVGNVISGSSAADAGLEPGDVVLSLGGAGLVSGEHFWELIGPMAQVDVPMTLEVLGRPDGDGVRTTRIVELVPDEERITESRLDTYPLRTSALVQRLTGMQLGELSAELATQVFDTDGPVTLITGVMSGSPAYLAGLRRGDRIVACDERDAPGLDEIIAAVDARASGDKLADRADEASPADGPVSVRVDGPLGWHVAQVAVARDLEERTEFDFPILFDWESDVNSLQWSFLDFILQFGASYSRSYTESETREPRRWSKLSFFPFGLFEFETGPVWREYTFLWFITWKTAV